MLYDQREVTLSLCAPTTVPHLLTPGAVVAAAALPESMVATLGPGVRQIPQCHLLQAYHTPAARLAQAITIECQCEGLSMQAALFGASAGL